MPLAMKQLSRGRFDFSKNLSMKEIRKLVSDPELEVLQTSSPVEAQTWTLINEDLLPFRPELQVRVYGFYSTVCDLSFVNRLNRLRHFSADCLLTAVGVEQIPRLELLKSLSIGIFDLESFDFLKEIPSTVTRLALEATKSKKPRLNHLSRFLSLKSLYLEGQQNDIEVLSNLTAIEDITLRSIATDGLNYLSGLERLWSLDIKLGGIRDLSAIQGKESIKYLELWQIQGLRDIRVISTLYGLQYLFLQSLRNVIAIPDLSKLCKLRRVYLENLKALVDVSALSQSPSLREFIHVSAQNMKPEQYAYLLKSPTLQTALVGFGSKKKNTAFERMMQEANVQKFGRSEFVFD